MIKLELYGCASLTLIQSSIHPIDTVAAGL